MRRASGCSKQFASRGGAPRLPDLVRLGAAILLVAAIVAPAWAGTRDQARRIHDRLVGVPPDETVLQQMTALVGSGQPEQAAEIAMQDDAFYNVALKNFVTPWTNVERTVFAPLNDYTATVIGIIRDEVPFDRVLWDDIVYVGRNGVVANGYSQTDNVHYEQLEQSRVNLADPLELERRTQSGLPNSPLAPPDTAGVITTRAAAEAFFSAGTNRRMWRFTAVNYLCRDMEQLHDVSRPADRIRQDVNRSPGGDSQLFHQQCIGCHSGMDPMAGAYAYYEWDAAASRLVYSPGAVQGKHLINANTFPGGYVTVDDSWQNFWRQGINGSLGWGATAPSGFGAKSLGQEVAASRAFAVCQVEKVFKHVCFRPPQTSTDALEIESIADDFQVDYRMKSVFARVAAHCMGN